VNCTNYQEKVDVISSGGWGIKHGGWGQK